MAAIAVLLPLLAAPLAQAATLRVPADHPTVQAAIDAAAPGDVIEIAAGTYVVTSPIRPNGKAVTIRGTRGSSGQLLTVLDGGDASQVIECASGETPLTRFEDLSITRGLAAEGGGARINGASPSFVRCSFSANQATAATGSARGGALLAQSSGSTFVECSFIDNAATATASSSYGGAIALSNATCYFDACVFDGNRCGTPAPNTSTHFGGAVSVRFRSVAMFERSSFVGNACIGTSNGGGAAYCEDGCFLSLNDCELRGNTSNASGAIWTVTGESTAPRIESTVICGNGSNQINGLIEDAGGNCIAQSCTDANADGWPDACIATEPATLEVPSEFPTLQAAMTAARSGDTIQIAAGSYSIANLVMPDLEGGTITVTGAAGKDGTPLTELVTGSTVTSGFLPFRGDRLTLRSLRIVGVAAWAYYSRLEILDCEIRDAANRDSIYCYACSMVAERSRWLGNSDVYDGGAMRLWYGSANFLDCDFESNELSLNGSTTSPFLGGAIALDSVSSARFEGCEFRANASWWGSAVFAEYSGPVSFVACLFEDNLSDEFGAAALLDTDAIFESCVFDSNHAVSNINLGEAIAIAQAALSLRDCTFTGHTRGVLTIEDSSAMIEGCDFNSNGVAGSGTLINAYQIVSNGPVDFPIELVECGFHWNASSAAYGTCLRTEIGGINQPASPARLVRCSFTQNTTPTGSFVAVSNDSYDSWRRPAEVMDSLFCGNPSSQLYGCWIDRGGNCFSTSCTDADGDTVPDTCGPSTDPVREVPAEYPTVQAALDASHPGDVVQIGAGVFPIASTLQMRVPSVTLRGSIDAQGVPTTVLDGGGLRRILTVTGALGSLTTIENIRFANGKDSLNGGGLRIECTGALVRNCEFIDCKATCSGGGCASTSGGAIALADSQSVIRDCVFRSNVASSGSAIHMLRANATIESCDMTLNSTGSTVVTNGTLTRLGGNRICGNTGTQVAGSFTDLGGNCINASCDFCIDDDGDSVPNPADNCPTVPNPGQQDCDADGTGDACESVPDCNGNGIPDNCDLTSGAASDCNANGVPDACDVASGAARDCDGDGVLDGCEIAAGAVADCNSNGVPDPCEDDSVDRATPNLGALSGIAPRSFVFEDLPRASTPVTIVVRAVGDLGAPTEFASLRIGTVTIASSLFATNGRDCPESPDVATVTVERDTWNSLVAPQGGTADVTMTLTASPLVDGAQCAAPLTTIALSYGGPAYDCNGNGLKDICETVGGVNDCNGNGRPDSCDVASGAVPDCNANGIPDSCDIASGLEDDKDGDGRPDSCEYAAGDFDLDGVVGAPDLSLLLILWGTPNPPVGDLDGDGMVGAQDLAALLLRWGPLP